MSSPSPPTPAALAAATALMLAAGCAPEPARDPFTATGQVIAFSGGDAGASRACFTCHGLQGEGDGRASPRLAGLPAGYLQRQLIDYADGRRSDKLMSPIAKALDDDDRRAVAAYYAALPAPVPARTEAAAETAAAARLYRLGAPERGLPACATCHGEAGEGLGPANPPLAGQPAAYLAEQLKRWRRSERRNDPQNVMLAVSRRLTPAEVERISRYVSALGPAAAPAAGFQAASR
jgi:cytochrome c553